MDTKALWHEVLESIKVSVSSGSFSAWFSQTHLVSLTDSKERILAQIGCPTVFIKNTVEARYYGLIRDALVKSLGKSCDLVFVVKENPDRVYKKPQSDAPLFDSQKDGGVDFKDRLYKTKIRANFSFENFAVSSSNQMAHAAAEAVSKNPGDAYNPLFLWGGVGVGKTHLMNAVGLSILQKDARAKVLLCTGEDFTNDIVEGIRNKTTAEVRKKYRKLDALFIDDIQFIAGKEAVQVEFFHTFNAVTGSHGQIILTSDRPPSEISKLEERLKSRFEAGLIVDIAPPDFELRCAIIQIKSKERGLDLPMDLVQMIAGNLDSARKMEGFLTKLLTQLTIKNTQVNEELIQSLLGKGVEENPLATRVKPEEVITAVSKYYSVGKRALLGDSRARSFARPRQVLMYILRRDIRLSLEEVGRCVGRDHTTVMHAVEKITQLASSDVRIREDLLGIKKYL